MSLAVLLNSALEENECQPEQNDLGEVTAQATITALHELPLRVEVFEKAQNQVDDLSIATVHEVLDALIQILQGE